MDTLIDIKEEVSPQLDHVFIWKNNSLCAEQLLEFFEILKSSDLIDNIRGYY